MLYVEQLEGRMVPAISYSGGVVSVLGTTGADQVEVTDQGATFSVRLNAEVQTFAKADVAIINSNLLGGDDTYESNLADVGPDAIFEIVYGGDGADSIALGNGDARVLAGRGNDTILSRGAAGSYHYLDGGAGADSIVCGPGHDTIRFDALDTVLDFDPTNDLFV